MEKTIIRIVMAIILLGLLAVLISIANAGTPDSKALYESNCAMCHKVDGSGMPPMFPPLKDDNVKKMTDAELIKVITGGRNGMPAFGEKISDQEIKGIIAYIRRTLQ